MTYIPKLECYYFNTFFPDSQTRGVEEASKVITVFMTGEGYTDYLYIPWFALNRLPKIQGIIADEEMEFD